MTNSHRGTLTLGPDPPSKKLKTTALISVFVDWAQPCSSLHGSRPPLVTATAHESVLVWRASVLSVPSFDSHRTLRALVSIGICLMAYGPLVVVRSFDRRASSQAIGGTFAFATNRRVGRVLGRKVRPQALGTRMGLVFTFVRRGVAGTNREQLVETDVHAARTTIRSVVVVRFALGSLGG